jgi:hypothetical protein
MSYLLIDFQTLNLHAVIRHDAQVAAVTVGAALHALGQQRDELLAVMAPAFGFLLVDMKLAAFRQRAAADQIKAKLQGAGFHAREGADFQPDAGDAAGVVLAGMAFDKFDCALAKGDFVHGASGVNWGW